MALINNPSRSRALISAWLPVIAWLAIIALESTGMLSSANTHSLLQRALALVFGPLDKHFIDVTNAVLRKTGHFVGYATLCLLFFRALARSAPAVGLQRLYFRWLAICSVVFTFCVAALDEYHQTRLSSRTGKFYDVLLDTAGAVCVQLLLMGVIGRRRSGRQVIADTQDTPASSNLHDTCCAVSDRPHQNVTL